MIVYRWRTIVVTVESYFDGEILKGDIFAYVSFFLTTLFVLKDKEFYN